jgi:hypothetical protein
VDEDDDASEATTEPTATAGTSEAAPSGTKEPVGASA